MKTDADPDHLILDTFATPPVLIGARQSDAKEIERAFRERIAETRRQYDAFLDGRDPDPPPLRRWFGFGARHVGYARLAYVQIGIDVDFWPPGIVLSLGRVQFWIQT